MMKVHSGGATARRAARLRAQRAGGLLSTTALGASLLVFAAPGQAAAQDECGANAGAPIVCVGGAYNGGIRYDGLTQPLNLTVPQDAVVSTAGDGQHGVSASGGQPVTILAPGAISTGGQFADGVRVDGGASAVSVTTGTVSASGAASAGVRVATTSGAVSIVSGSATTSGDTLFDSFDVGTFSEAISAYTDSGNITIDSGLTNVSGLYASGVAASTRIGNIAITSDEVISTAPNGAVAIGAGNTEGGDITITSGAVTAVSAGIQALGWGKVAIDSGTVDITGALRAGAIYADTAGDVLITSDAITNVSAGGRGIAVFARGDVDVTSGAIETTGASYLNASNILLTGNAIQVRTEGDIQIDSGSISTAGDSAIGIRAFSPTGAVTIASGTIETTGANASGILVDNDGIVPFTGHRGADPANGTGLLSITSGSIVATGNGANGILVDHVGDIAIDSGTIESGGPGIYVYSGGTIDILSGSVIVENGFAPGIVARTVAGDIRIDSGYAQAHSDAAIGAVSNSGAVHIISDFTLTTLTGAPTGQFPADAVFGRSDTGAVTIESGRAEVRSDFATGVAGVSQNGNVTVTSAEVLTSGLQSYGLYASTQGDVLITSGEIATSGVASIGIAAFGYAGLGGNVSVTSDSITTTGERAYGVIAQAMDGVATVVSGEVTTSGAGAYGVRAIGAGGVSITSGSVVTSGDLIDTSGTVRVAHGLWAESAAGDIVVDSGAVTVSGVGASGLNLLASNGSITVDSDAISVSGDAGQVGSTAYFANGIYARSDAGGDVTINTGTVDVTGARGWGVYGRAFGGAVSVTSGDVTVAGDGGRGIYAVGQSDVSVISGGVTTGGGIAGGTASEGIYAWSLNGALSVDSGSVVTAGDRSVGIFASGSVGPISVISDAVTTAGLYADGVNVWGGAAAVTVSSGAVQTSGDGAAGIRVTTTSGDVSITSASAIAQGDTLFDPAGVGTYAEAITAYTDTGDITIVSGRTEVSGLYASGVSATTRTGNISVSSQEVVSTADGAAAIAVGNTEAGDITISSGSVTTASAGIQALGWGAVTIDSGAVNITGDDRSTGIYVDAAGDTTITSDAVTNVSAGGRGVAVFSAGDVAIDSGSVTTGGASFLNASNQLLAGHGLQVRTPGDITIVSGSISTAGEAAYGVLATSQTGVVDITSQSIETTGAGAHGIAAFADVAATISTGDITVDGAGAAGVFVQGGDLTLNVTGDVVAALGTGAHLELTGAAEINVAAGTSLQGGLAGLYIDSQASSTINILGEIVGLGDGLALQVVGAPVTINNNSNTIIGGIALTDGADTFNNNGVWMASGASDFGTGDDVIVNNGVFDASAAGGVTIAGLETFQNNASVNMRNGQLGDVVDLGGAAYVGGAGSQLLVDVDFSTGQSDSLAVGSAAGTTAIVVNNLATTPEFNAGLSFIESATPLTGDEFAIDPDSVEDGFLDYNLVFDPDTNSYVVQALPSSDSVSMLRAGAAAQDYAAKSGEAWSGRMEDWRDSSWAGVGRQGRTEAWGQLLIGDRRLEKVADFDLLGTVVTRDISSDAFWAGFQMGVDRAFAANGGDLILGATGGAMSYEMRFADDANSFDLKGANIGAYAAWRMGGLSLSGLAKVDRFTTTADLGELNDRDAFSGHSVDVQGEAAFRLGGPDYFVEPVAAIDWIHVHLDSMEAAGATATFNDVKSLRGRAGVRIGGRMVQDAYTLVPSLGVYAIEEFEGENRMNFQLGGTGYTVRDTPYDTHGRADLGLTIVGPMGLQAFAKGEIDFGDGAEGLTVRLGARWSW